MNVFAAVLFLGVFLMSFPDGRGQGYRYGNWGRGPSSRSRGFKNFPFSNFNDPGAAMGGVMLPSNSCLLTWQEFDTHVVGRDWIVTYGIDDDAATNPERSYKFKAFWERNGNNIIRKGSIWNDIANECQLFQGTFGQADPTLAIAKLIEGTAFATSDRVDRYISCDPKSFLLFYICYVKPVGKRCPQAEILLMVPDQRAPHPSGNGTKIGDIILNDVPWSKIEKTFKRCTKHVFVDDTPPQIEWLWQLTECPNPNNI